MRHHRGLHGWAGALFPLILALAAMPDAGLAEGVPLSFVPAGGCAGPPSPQEVDDDRPRPWRVLGWLYRTFRDGGPPRPDAPPLLLYLRSPLLAGFADDVDCPAGSKPVRTPGCEAAGVLARKDGARIVEAVLPQLGASTAADLIQAVRSRLEAGSAVTLRTKKGREAVLLPDDHGEVVVTACDPKHRMEEDGPPRPV